MDTDFSCDYLVDITGLVDNGENLYSCCHPSGVMCGKEDCPVVIDFNKRCLKDTEENDYDGLTRGKLCPLKQGIGIDHWRECDGPRCAWYDQATERCAALSIARNK